MNNPDHIDVNEAMLAKYMSGEASPEEASAIDQWVNASARNRLILDQAMTVWARIPENKSWQLPDKDKWLKDFREKISGRPLRSLKRILWTSAAAVLILIASTILWLTKPDSTPGKTAPWITRSGGAVALTDTLPDQSLVDLGHQAIIKYPAHFTGSSREVKLWGNASFVVTADPGKPFIVDVEGIKIKVLGTSFNIRPDTTVISVEVQSGIVRMIRGDSGMNVSAFHTGVYDRKTGQFSLTNGYKPVRRSLNFKNVSLKQIADKLEEAYGVQVIFENKQLENCTMSSRFDNESLQFVLKVVSITLNIHYRIDKNTVYLDGEGCN